MSLDIFLQCYRNGEPATFKRAAVEEIFTREAVDYLPPLTDVNYADGGGGAIYGADEEDDIQHMMFNHCGGKTFFAALYELAHRTKSVVVKPFGERQIAVTDTESIAHLPAGFGERMGEPVVVSSGRELEVFTYGSN